MLLSSPHAINKQISFNSILIRGKKKNSKKLTGLYTPQRKITQLSD